MRNDNLNRGHKRGEREEGAELQISGMAYKRKVHTELNKAAEGPGMINHEGPPRIPTALLPALRPKSRCVGLSVGFYPQNDYVHPGRGREGYACERATRGVTRVNGSLG